MIEKQLSQEEKASRKNRAKIISSVLFIGSLVLTCVYITYLWTTPKADYWSCYSENIILQYGSTGPGEVYWFCYNNTSIPCEGCTYLGKGTLPNK